MTNAAYERLKKINELQGKKFKELSKVHNDDWFFTSRVWHLTKLIKGIFLIRNIDNCSIKITHIGEVFNILNEGVYISNLSLLLNETNIIHNYVLTDQDWQVMLKSMKLGTIYDKFSIIKVDDMEVYAAGKVLQGKYVLINKTPCHIIIQDRYKKERIWVSDVNLVLSNTVRASYFTYHVRHLKISNIDISNRKLNEVNSLRGFFSGVEELESIELENFDTRYVKVFSTMFAGCTSLKSIKFDSFRTDNAVDFDRMFENCKSLEILDLNCFDVRRVSSFYKMFYGCTNLRELHIGNWVLDTKKGMDFESMFENCKSLRVLDKKIFIKHINKPNKYKTNDMFKNTIYDYDIENETIY